MFEEDGRCTKTVRALMQVLLRSGQGPQISLSVFKVSGRFSWVPGLLFYHASPSFGSVFWWRCFCRQKHPCTCKYPAILNLSFPGLDEDMAIKWHYNLSPGRILGVFYTICDV